MYPLKQYRLLAFMMALVLVCGWGSSAANGQATQTSEFVQRFRRFYQLYPFGEKTDLEKRSATNLLRVLDDYEKSQPQSKAILAYYSAHLNAILGNRAEARALAVSVARDRSNLNSAEARMLLNNLGFSPLGEERQIRPADTFAHLEAYLGSIQEIYPKGRIADAALALSTVFRANKGLKVTSSRHQTMILATDFRPVAEAGELYRQMQMYNEAIETLRCAIGLMDEQEWIGRHAASIWMVIGDCYAAQGEWERALTCYYKSLASGQSLAEITLRVYETDTAMLERRVVAGVSPKADAGKLERISELLANAELLDPAIDAEERARKTRGAVGASPLSRSLHLKKAELLRRAVELYGEGVTVRGNIATKELIESEELLGRQFG